MKLSLAAELAVRGVLVLSERYGQGPVTLDIICASRDLPKQYLTKIFASLVKAGLIAPIRGKHGGYTLMRKPAEITILEIVEAVEGPILLNFCQHSPPQCERNECRVRPVWAELQKTIREKLSSLSLADCLARPEPAKTDS